jgi:Fe-S cluster biosynthesis and repair protein YggX
MAETNTVACRRCGNKKAHALPKAPFPNALGERIHTEICQDCWKAWLAKQNQLMNHYGLNTMDPDHRAMLLQNLKAFLFEQGETAGIDESMQGKITHIQK